MMRTNRRRAVRQADRARRALKVVQSCAVSARERDVARMLARLDTEVLLPSLRGEVS